MIRKCIFFLLILLPATRGIAQMETLDHYLNQLQETHIMPGFSVVVVQGEEQVFLKGFGREYIDEKGSMTINTSTAVGSLTKSFTALAIMQLFEAGEIDLDQAVVHYLPWFRTANKMLSDKITVRMLLNNTSGLRAPQVRSKETSDKALENLVRSLESVYLTREPGTSYEYSNEGFAVAGLLIQEVSGWSYDRYLEEFIFKPLEMHRTTNDPRAFNRLDVLYGHYHGIDQAIPVRGEDELLREFSPAGSLMRSSAKDVGNYLQVLLNGGEFKGKRLISEESLGKMWKPYSSFPGISKEDGGENLPLKYGFGWFLGEMEGKDYIFHGGNRRNMSSMTFLCPDRKIGAALLTNIDLTLIDRYEYHNLIHILNNIIRLSLGEDVSDFALPVVKDPTRNTYELPLENESKYLGTYSLTEGADWVFLGSQLSISRGENGLEAEIRKGEQVIERFTLDFVTRKTAVSRNLYTPQHIHFKFLSGGEISDLYIGGRKYSRITEEYLQKYHRVTSPEDIISFHFPRTWNMVWKESDFSASNDASGTVCMQGRVIKSGKVPEELFLEMFPGHRIIHTGLAMSEIQGSFHWKEVAISSTQQGSSFQHLVCITKKEHLEYVIVLSTRDNLTGSLIHTIPNILRTFSWR